MTHAGDQASVRATMGQALLGLALANVGVAWVIGLGYLQAAPPRGGMQQQLFVHLSLFGQLAAFPLLIAAALALASRLPGVPRVVPYVAPLLYTALNAVLFVDRGIYALFRFHINGLVIEILTTKGGWATMDIPAEDVALLVVGVLVLIAAEWITLRTLMRRPARPPRVVRKGWMAAVGVLAAMLLVDRVIYCIADLRGAREIVRASRIVPLYTPITMRKWAYKAGLVPRDGNVALPSHPKSFSLVYPRVPLVFEEPAETPNVLWLVLDSWRHDAFSPENTPEIWEFAKDAQVFGNHLSGGNRTASGVFSMFYGLYGSYWDSVLSERRGPVLVDRLKSLDYRIKGMSSMPVAFLDVRQSVFIEAQDGVVDQWEHERASDRDRQMVDLIDAATAPDGEGRPFFIWALFDSSHVGYDFPEEGFAKYEPFAKQVGYREMGVSEQRKIEAHNRYRNSVLYVDHLVGKALDNLEARGLTDETIVIITSDHGEEFYEHGFWTHGGGCTPEEVRVPLIVRVPGKGPGRIERMTSHLDLAPTLMQMLGTKNDPDDYTLGNPLFASSDDPHVIACGWKQSALVDENGWVIFGTESNNVLDFEIYDADYVEVKDTRAAMSARTAEVARAIKNMRAFSK